MSQADIFRKNSESNLAKKSKKRTFEENIFDLSEKIYKIMLKKMRTVTSKKEDNRCYRLEYTPNFSDKQEEILAELFDTTYDTRNVYDKVADTIKAEQQKNAVVDGFSNVYDGKTNEVSIGEEYAKKKKSKKHKENRLTENEMLNLMFVSDVREQVFKMLEEEGFECIIFSPERNIHSSVIKVFW